MHNWSTSECGVQVAEKAFTYQIWLTNKSRHTNLALLQTYGSNAWRIHNYLLDSTAKQAEKALEDLKQLTIEVNRERKNTQVCRHLSTFLSRQVLIVISS